ncbi:hypothetical protein OJAV_G00164850 [Oryzias javanicus]|uniref:ADP-ribosylation factor-like protein 6 n=1 Tax=Oryzias javanicus TaxID=123683 RepID=A0A437CK92_ORYJA|nr:hypothetical protein OJAV_G00164850 [Oryzias javanicus]
MRERCDAEQLGGGLTNGFLLLSAVFSARRCRNWTSESDLSSAVGSRFRFLPAEARTGGFDSCAEPLRTASLPSPFPCGKMGNGLSDQPKYLSSIFQSFHIAILGLDSAGKTTILYRLQFNEFVNTVPTKGFNSEKEKLRPLWKSYTRCTDGIIFVVDSVDAERMEEAKTELHKIAKSSENQGVPLLVVANKQDLRNSLSLEEIEKLLALKELGPAVPWHLQASCAIIGEGLGEGLDRLHEMVLKRRRMLRQQKKKR